MKCIFLLIASNNFEHQLDEATQRKTWAKELPNVIWLRGGESTIFDPYDRNLYVPVEETYENILKKTILGINWCLENLEFDFLIRGNVSTYFVPERLNALLGKINCKEDFFGGYVEFMSIENQSKRECLFINGSALFLSRSVAEKVSSINVSDWNEIPDDFAISRSLFSQGVVPTSIARGNIGQNSIFGKRAFYRLKSSENAYMASLRMENVDRILKEPRKFRRLIGILRYYKNEFMFWKKNYRTLYGYILSAYSVLASMLNCFLISKTVGIKHVR